MRTCVCVVLVAGLMAAGCEKKGADKPAAGAAASDDKKVKDTPGGQMHVVRGEVQQLPVAGEPSKNLMIHHEAIPGWVFGSNRPNGMASMTMAFPPKAGVSLEGIAVGDIVEFEVEQVAGAKPPWVLTRIAKLPAETKLDFGGKVEKK